MYREHEFVERCQCNEPAIAPCAACGRARCALHLERGLCNRCTQWIGRELDARTTGRWVKSGVLGTVLSLGMLAGGMIAGPVVALPVSIATYFGLRTFQRRRLIVRMGPSLSASKGELPPPERKPDIDRNSGRGGLPPGVAGW